MTEGFAEMDLLLLPWRKYSVVLTQVVITLIIITQLRNKTKWYISTIST